MVRPVWKPLAVVVAALALAGAGVVLVISPAGAHTDFIGADPHDGASLHAVPRTLELQFSDAMDPALSTVNLQVKGGDNTPLQLRNGANLNVLVATVPTSLDPEDGTTTAWRISFRVVSRDGHPVAGTSQFVVRIPESAPATGSAYPSPTPENTESPDAAGDRSAVEKDAADGSGLRTSETREVWPLVALAVGVLVLLALTVGAVMRAVRRDPDA